MKRYHLIAGLLRVCLALLVTQVAFAETVATPTAPVTKINAKDGAQMVWVPAGAFLMGSPTGVGYASEQPQRTVTLDGYWIYQNDVTVAQFRAFTTATGYHFDWKGRQPAYGWQDSNPMTDVTWLDARAYCAWAGVSLPTEAQWEKAARGTDGRNFPWGGQATAQDWTLGWDWGKCASGKNSNAGNGHFGPWPVGSFPAGASPYGALDMAGNVWQWCADWYGSYDAASPAANPSGPASGTDRVLRGGSWDGDAHLIYVLTFRSTHRGGLSPYFWGSYVGFRAVASSAGA